MKYAKGQSIVEFVLTATVLLILLGGILDLANILNAQNTLQNAAFQGALAGSFSGKNTAADCSILAAIYNGSQGLSGVTISQIIIYQANVTGNPLGGSQSIAYEDIYAGNPGCSSAAAPPAPTSANWLPAARNNFMYQNANLGIKIVYVYAWQTNLLPFGSITLSVKAVAPMNPQPAP